MFFCDFLLFFIKHRGNKMLPTDPKEAAKLGQAWGETITDSVFGIVDVFKNRKAMKAVNTAKVINRNAVTEINNKITRNNNALKIQAMKEIAQEQEQEALRRMSPAQRQAYYLQKNEAAKEAARAAREAKIRHEERVELFWLCFVVLFLLPVMVWGGLLIWGMTDIMACYSMKGFIPLMKAICGR
jgi:hypothetical protein